ncbi:MAG: glutamate racemase [Chloroflexi bacterium]|nr:glutamate racemase [Chloroflexota bacterium]
MDSGVGGLSVLREIHRLLPAYPTLYFADQGHLPYGPRPAQEILLFTENIVRFLLQHGAGMIVIACHTASAPSLHVLRAQYPRIPIVGIEPAVKPAAEATQSGVIGVLTTQGTANGTLYQSVLERFAKNVRVMTYIAPELVTMVEEQTQHTAQGRALLRRAVQPMLEAGADQIALACTHFPFLVDELQAIVGPGVRLIDPGPAVARQTARVLPAALRPNPAPNAYYTSGDPQKLQHMLRALIGVEAQAQQALVPSRLS